MSTFGGKPEDYEDWNFKWLSFLTDEPMIQQVLKAIGEEKHEPDETKISEVVEMVKQSIMKEKPEQVHEQDTVNREVYKALCLNLEEKSDALGVMKNLVDKDKYNGILGWWKLGRDVNSMTSQRLQSLAGKVYGPKRVKNYQDVPAAMEEWEMHLKQFERSEQPLSEQTKLWSIRQIVPDELESDIIKNPDLNDWTFLKVKGYIAEQCATRRDRPKSHKTTGPVPLNDMASKVLSMLAGEPKADESHEGPEHDECSPCGGGDQANEEDSPLGQLMSFMKGYMGKGGGKGGFGGKGGKGGGKFDGNCNHCGAYGHRMADCFKKDREMQEYRKGKGKNGGGKGFDGGGKGFDGGGKGGGKGYGGWPKGGGKGKGTYMFENQNQNNWNQNSGGAWTLSLTKSSQKTPGLNSKVEVSNKWETLQDESQELDEKNREDIGRMMLVSEAYVKQFPAVPMGNYSKRSEKIRCARVDMRQVQKEQRSWGRTCAPPTDEADGPKPQEGSKPLKLFVKESVTPSTLTKPLNSMEYKKCQEGGWIKVKGAMDSGATESVAPPDMCPNYDITPSPGSLAGVNYVSASDDLIPNLGEQVLDVETMDGRGGQVKYQIADVSRPLNSVSEICDAGGPQGQHVIFGRWGGAIINLDTGRQVPFPREDGIYNLEFWVKPRGKEEASVFPRQGS